MRSSIETKEKILQTAGSLFYKQGYNSTGINQIIEESEIAKASLYHHFKSKSDLLYAYLEGTHQNWFEQLHQYIDPIADPKNKILGMFDFRIKRQVVNQYNGCPFIKAGAEVPQDDKKAFEIIDSHKMKFKALIAALLQDIHPASKMLSKEELTDTIFMLLEGATVTANFQKNSNMMASAKEIVVKLLK